jgi:energy-coupling factor transporter ATP-binding protein EcfA2
MDQALTTQGLTKSYGKILALRGVDLEVEGGEILGFLGPNGAGKTTTIRCLLDLILSQPVSRSRLFLGRYLGFVSAVALVLLVGWLTWVLPPGSRDMGLTWIEFLRPFLPLAAELLLFGTLAVLLSLVLPASRTAGMTAGGLLVANYLLVGLANINQDLLRAVEFTPLHYYQGGSAIHGLKWGWLGGLLAISAGLALLAWWRFQRRDIRVGGERSWKLPALPSLLRRQGSGEQDT